MVIADLLGAVAGPLVASGWPSGSTEGPGEGSADAAAPVPPTEAAAPRPDDRSRPGAPAAGPDDLAQSTAPLRTADAADPYVAIDEQPWLFTTNTAAGNVPVVTGGWGATVLSWPMRCPGCRIGRSPGSRGHQP